MSSVTDDANTADLPQNRYFDEAPAPREWLVPAAFLVLMLAQLLLGMVRLSQTSDEANHLHAGYRYWQCRDFGYNPEHPPLSKLVAAWPLRFMSLRDPLPGACGGNVGSDFQTGRQFLFANDARRVLFIARLAESLFVLATLLLAWYWTRLRFGRTAAAFAALLLAFEPTLLAHGALVTNDAALTFGFIATAAALYVYFEKPTVLRALLAGIAIALPLASKFAGVIVIPVAISLASFDVVLRVRRSKLPDCAFSLSRFAAHVATAVMACFLFLWANYGFRFASRPGGGQLLYNPADWQHTAARFVPPLLKMHLLPEAFLMGMARQVARSGVGQPTFIFGNVYATGTWFYFPAALLIKLTVPILLLTVLAIFAFLARRDEARAHFRDLFYLAVPPLIFLAFAMNNKIDIGVRHVLPVFPFVIIFAAAGAALVWERWPAAKWSVVALLVLHVATSLHAAPDYISYANEFFGGSSRTYKLLTDSNTDWGQSLIEVANDASRRGAQPCWILSPYNIPIAYYGVLCRDLRNETSQSVNGTVYVSSTAWSGVLDFEQDFGSANDFRNRKPDASVGGSAFLVYRGDFDLTSTRSLLFATAAINLVQQGRAPEALQLARESVRLRPNAGYPHYAACAALAATGSRADAATECRTSVAILVKHPDFNRRLLNAVEEFSRNAGTN